MALVVTVSKKSVQKSLVGLYRISVNMVLTDNSVEVLNRFYSTEYRTGDSITSKQADLQARMQADIDNYKAEQIIYTASAFDTVITNIQSGLTV